MTHGPKRPSGTPFLCPVCQQPLRVVNTYQRQGAIRRRRACPDKHVRITTKEVPLAA